MNTWVYVDGFNLYNGLVRGTPFKWLNLFAFSQCLLPNDMVVKVKYFTARLDARPHDPDQPLRQIAYWRALRTLPQIEIIEGRFLTKKARLPEAGSVDRIKVLTEQGADVTAMRPHMVDVYRSEEKGTDVNLAVHLLHDAHLGRFDAAAIVSNDSDLQEAIRLVRRDIGLVVGVFNPHRDRPSVELRKTASFFRDIPKCALRTSQFTGDLEDARGRFSKPRDW